MFRIFCIALIASIAANTLLVSAYGVGTASAPKHERQSAKIKPVISGKPVRIHIPRLALDLPIVDGSYNPDAKTWTLSKTTAQYATITPLVNNTAGNTFIYGHNNAKVFSKILSIQPGDEMIIMAEDGKRYYYLYQDNYDVGARDVDAIKHEGKPRVTVQTCVGVNFELRRMFQFEFVKVEA